MNRSDFISVLPGNMLDKDGVLTSIIEALGLQVQPIPNQDLDNSRSNPPTACLRVNGKLYSLVDVLKAMHSSDQHLSTDYVDISEHTTAETAFITPSRGYVFVKSSSTSTTASINIDAYTLVQSRGYRAALGVHKGAKVYVDGNVANATFVPLVND